MPSKTQRSVKAPATPVKSAPAKGAAGTAKPAAKFRMRIMAGDVIAIGPGKIALLEAIADAGSITSAAKQLDMSYRRAWLLLDELNHALRKPAVDSAQGGQAGGGSVLTDTGRELIELYRRIETTAQQACQADLKRMVGMIAR
jgi:molybdate transport system regulatory protein